MVDQKILDYIKKELARGVSEAKLRHVLMEHGWPEFEINEAFEKTKGAEPEKISEEKPELKLPKSGEVQEAVKKPHITEYVKKIVLNKIFIIAAAVIILGSVAFFILPSLFENGEDEGISGAIDHAKTMCRQYCQSNLCGLVNDPGFTHPELEGKNCRDLGFPCLQPSGEPKCETIY